MASPFVSRSAVVTAAVDEALRVAYAAYVGGSSAAEAARGLEGIVLRADHSQQDEAQMRAHLRRMGDLLSRGHHVRAVAWQREIGDTIVRAIEAAATDADVARQRLRRSREAALDAQDEAIRAGSDRDRVVQDDGSGDDVNDDDESGGEDAGEDEDDGGASGGDDRGGDARRSSGAAAAASVAPTTATARSRHRSRIGEVGYDDSALH